MTSLEATKVSASIGKDGATAASNFSANPCSMIDLDQKQDEHLDIVRNECGRARQLHDRVLLEGILLSDFYQGIHRCREDSAKVLPVPHQCPWLLYPNPPENVHGWLNENQCCPTEPLWRMQLGKLVSGRAKMTRLVSGGKGARRK